MRLHRMQELQTIVIDVRGVSPSGGSTRLRCAKTAEQINILLGVNTLGGPRHIVLDGGPDPPQRRERDSMQPSPNYFGFLLECNCNRISQFH